MKKLLSLGLVLLTIVYAFPLAYRAYYRGVDATISQEDVLSAAKPVDASVDSADAATTGTTDVSAADTTDSAAAQTVSASLPDSGNIRVLVDGTVHTMPLETYVAGVVSAEISPTFPADALRAQAVAARTYAVHKMRTGGSALPVHKGADVCDDYHHCTAYLDLATQASAHWGKNADTYENAVERAVHDTAGQILTVGGKPIVAVFCAASSPRTESAKDVWGSDISYLQSVESPGGEACPKYKTEVTVSAADFRKKVHDTFPSIKVDGAPDTWFKASARSAAGGIKTVALGGVRVEGTAIREMFDLCSTNFTITPSKDAITFHVTGYGHGVGLSQYGAKYMAEHGSGYRDILTHYYIGATIQNLSDIK